MRPASRLLLPALCILAGCQTTTEPSKGLPTVANNQFGPPPQRTVASLNLPPADSVQAARVDSTGRKLLALNKGAGLDPKLMFILCQAPSVEIFHVGKDQVFVTEALVRKCSADQLAAVLAAELGKMVAERKAASRTVDLNDLQGPPVDLRIGSDNLPQQSYQVELAHYEANLKARKMTRPDPRQLAEIILEKAGISKDQLTAVQPILNEASLNRTVETQIKGPRQAWEP